MYRFVTILLVVCLGTSAYGDTDQIGMPPMPDGRIVGGTATDIQRFPHQISMRYNGRHRCGGSIYSPTIIVSAAHCVVGVEASVLTIAAGSTFLSVRNAEVPVAKIIIHEGYRTINNDNDVAILVLAEPLQFSGSIQSIGLAASRPAVGTEVIVTGWGTLVEDGSIPDELQKVSVNYVENSACKSSYSLMLTSRMLCAGVSGGGKDACQGDSGGPLIVGNELLGIVSWGIGCARSGYPGVYASVPDLRDWIINTVENNTNAY